MSNSFIRVPPDSTGKKVRNSRSLDIEIGSINIEILNSLNLGDSITSTSGGSGFFAGYVVTGRNIFFLYLDDTVGTFNTNDELFVGSTAWSTIVNSSEIYTQKMIISDVNVPNNSLKVDNNGSAYVRFSDGNLNLDAFGNLKISSTTNLKSYVFYYGRDPLDFIDVINGGGSIVEEPEKSQIKLVTDTNNGSSVSMTSYLYFPYVPQQSNTATFSIAMGDLGKENVVRRWGLYDDEDGIYFEFNDDVLSVNIRNSNNDSLLSVSQENFNKNTLTSEVFDIFKLDVTKYNLYWISYQWQGVGVVRFGVHAPNGERIPLHEFNNPNTNIVPYMKRGTLPVRLEQLNTSVTASTSEFKSSCIVVSRDSDKLDLVGNIVKYVCPVKTVTNTATPLLSLRLNETVNGENNRVMIQPYQFQYFIEDEPVIIEFFLNGDLVGSNFFQYTQFSELDTESTEIDNAFLVDADIYGVGQSKEVSINDLNFVILNSVPGIQNVVTVSARTIKNTTTAKVHFLAKWREVL